MCVGNTAPFALKSFQHNFKISQQDPCKSFGGTIKHLYMRHMEGIAAGRESELEKKREHVVSGRQKALVITSVETKPQVERGRNNGVRQLSSH